MFTLKKAYVIFAALLIISQSAFGADDWDKGLPTDSTNPNDLAEVLQENNAALDRLLFDYRKNATVIPDTTSQVKILPGELAIPNAAGSTVRWRRNDSTLTLTAAANLDTGSSFTNSTLYHIYAVADADAETFTGTISLSSSAPTGKTQYRKIGYFYVNASGEIISVGNIAGGDVTNLTFVSKNGDISTSSSSYSDMADMVLYPVVSGRPLELTWSGSLHNSAHSYCDIVFDVDGTDYGLGAYFGTSDAEGRELTTVSHVVYGLSSGAKTAKVQWKSQSGTCNSYAVSNRVFTIKEL